MLTARKARLTRHFSGESAGVLFMSKSNVSVPRFLAGIVDLQKCAKVRLKVKSTKKT